MEAGNGGVSGPEVGGEVFWEILGGEFGGGNSAGEGRVDVEGAVSVEGAFEGVDLSIFERLFTAGPAWVRYISESFE